MELNIEKMTSVIIEATKTTFEQMAFSDPIVSESKMDLKAEVNICSSILVNEPLPLEMALFVSRDLVEQVAETVFCFGAEEISDTEKLEDILRETLNTIGGLVMSNYLDDNVTFALGLPENKPADLDSDKAAIVVDFAVDESKIQIQLYDY